MDELLINACLQERKPSSLPWSIDDKEKNKRDDSVDGSTCKSPIDKGISTNIEQNQMELMKLGESCERECNNGSRYMGVDPDVNLQNVTRGVGVNTVYQSLVESQAKKEDLTYVGGSCLSKSDTVHSTNEYYRKIPMLYEINNQKQKQGANPAAATQINRRISPRCSQKVSRKMVQESTLGYPVNLQSKKTLSKRKDEVSISSVPQLKEENEYETKQMNQVQIDKNVHGKSCLPKNLDSALYTSKANLERENHAVDSINLDACRASDLNVDNELDNLLELTADAIDYRNNKRVKGNGIMLLKEHLRLTPSKDEKILYVDSSIVVPKDYENKNSSISKNLATVRNTAIYELRNGNENEQKEWGSSTCSKEEGIVAVKCPRDEIVDVAHADKQKRRVENMQVKELGEKFKRAVTKAIENRVDIINGVGVKGLDKEANETKRKRQSTNKIKKEKGQEKKEGSVMLETETEPRNMGRIRSDNAKNDEYKESISRDNYVSHRMGPKTNFTNKSDSAEDIFDISPITNKETLSDLEEDGSNNHIKFMERASELMKRDDGKEHKKNNEVNAVCSNVTKLIPEQTQAIPQKVKSKRSKKGKRENVTNTIKKKDSKAVDEQISHKKKKPKKKPKKVSKTSVKNELLPTEESRGRNKSDNGRQSAKTCDLVTKTKTSKVNSYVLKDDNETTHKIVDDEHDSYKTRRRLKSSKSYTVIKHDINTVTRIDMPVNNKCYIDKDSRGSENPFMREYMNPKNVNAGNEGKPIISADILKENFEKYQKMSSNTKKNDDVVKTTNVAKTKECNNQGNISYFQDMKLSDLINDSDKDSDMISDIQYQQYLTHRPSSVASSEFEFPRPASNRTFIIDIGNEDEDGGKEIQKENGGFNQQDNEEEKKLSKKQRFINFILCCFRPKTD